jgi:hypothetical protein
MASGDSNDPELVTLLSADGARRRLSFRPHLRSALHLLLEAHEYAVDLEQNTWELAVELDVLRSANLTNSDLRWLSAVGLVEHAVEITGPTDSSRQFRRTPLVNVHEPTCIVLTLDGVEAVREFCAGSQSWSHHRLTPSCRVVNAEEPVLQPKWDDQRRQLRVAAEVVKEFKLPSPNQETVLMAFEEEGWPPRIDDPLPPFAQIDPRRRLHDTIKALNRKQKRPLVRFMGDGSGEGIRWELISVQRQVPPQRNVARAIAE